MKEITVSEIESIDNAKLTYLVVHSISLTLVGALTALVIFEAIIKGLTTEWKFILAAVIGFILIAALLWAILDILDIMGSSRENLNDKLDSIDSTKTSYQIIKNIDNDEKYFVSEDGKAEFDKLSIDDVRNKKVYYESGYKLTKGETESDLTKYLGGKADHENLINNIKDVLKSYKLMFLLTALTVVVAIVIVYIFFSLRNANKAKLAEENRELFMQAKNEENPKLDGEEAFSGSDESLDDSDVLV